MTGLECIYIPVTMQHCQVVTNLAAIRTSERLEAATPAHLVWAQQPRAVGGLQREAPLALGQAAEVGRAGAGPPVVLRSDASSGCITRIQPLGAHPAPCKGFSLRNPAAVSRKQQQGAGHTDVLKACTDAATCRSSYHSRSSSYPINMKHTTYLQEVLLTPAPASVTVKLTKMLLVRVAAGYATSPIAGGVVSTVKAAVAGAPLLPSRSAAAAEKLYGPSARPAQVTGGAHGCGWPPLGAAAPPADILMSSAQLVGL